MMMMVVVITPPLTFNYAKISFNEEIMLRAMGSPTSAGGRAKFAPVLVYDRLWSKHSLWIRLGPQLPTLWFLLKPFDNFI